MWAIVRRKVASGSSAASSLSKIRPAAASVPRGYTTTAKEALLLGGGSKIIRNVGHYKYLGSLVSSKPVREVTSFLQIDSPIQVQHRPFSSDKGDLVDAVVPFMGESISDGTLAKFLKKPGDHVEVDEPIAKLRLISTKIAVISKSGEGVTHVAPSEKTPSKASPEPSPTEKEAVDKPKPKSELLLLRRSLKHLHHHLLDLQLQNLCFLPRRGKEERSWMGLSGLFLTKFRSWCYNIWNLFLLQVPMTRLRKRVATRLKDSQNTFAMLTTFNEVDMTNLMKLRSDYKDAFLEKHGVKLGLMSGFIKYALGFDVIQFVTIQAAVSGLQNQPIINAVIDGDDIIYRDYIDISIAVADMEALP
ncbi:Dihydrolipoyllysine-residue succinyltransferase component of 2-oxoglutarate dehydrogenase complex 2, mitochondrial [Vitis vinifera]|uniref:dihydrolipoyllysine-residue succinyltransferase n=1 Tax=Vitis vinifera TaxID=29760 RepID=A0A438EEC3_VITVI|nr:Dihydrolipoyllysine-residue succinyltransferase component of 2-oxoglutarate dehydrogenase complex 2, mitochondrial [Vitis vinifera]